MIFLFSSNTLPAFCYKTVHFKREFFPFFGSYRLPDRGKIAIIETGSEPIRILCLCVRPFRQDRRCRTCLTNIPARRWSGANGRISADAGSMPLRRPSPSPPRGTGRSSCPSPRRRRSPAWAERCSRASTCGTAGR